MTPPAAPPNDPPVTTTTHALIIAIQTYDNPTTPNLPDPIALPALTLATHLLIARQLPPSNLRLFASLNPNEPAYQPHLQTLAAHNIPITRPTGQAIADHLDSLTAATAETLLFFWTGHGLKDTKARYLLTADSYALDVTSLLRTLRSIRTSNIPPLLQYGFIDACANPQTGIPRRLELNTAARDHANCRQHFFFSARAGARVPADPATGFSAVAAATLASLPHWPPTRDTLAHFRNSLPYEVEFTGDTPTRADAETAAGPSASLPHFTGRTAELRELATRLAQPGALVPITGMAGLGKTYLARQFIALHGHDLFDSNVYQLNCQQSDLAALTADLTIQLNLPPQQGDAPTIAAELRRHLARKRCLLFLDNVDNDIPAALVPDSTARGKASFLVTTREPANIKFLAREPRISPLLFTVDECLNVFRSVLGETTDVATATTLAEKLGRLPIAIAVAAGLIADDPRHSLSSLSKKLPPLTKLEYAGQNVGQLFISSISAVGKIERRLITAIAACAPSGTKLDFAAEVAGLSGPSQADSLLERIHSLFMRTLKVDFVLEALSVLIKRSLVIELDREARRYALHPLIREAAQPDQALRRRHAKVTVSRLKPYEHFPRETSDYIEEATQALSQVTPSGPDDHMAANIALGAGNAAQLVGRLPEAMGLYRTLEALGEGLNQMEWLQRSYGNQALILQSWGQLDAAMDLHKKVEAISLKLNDLAGLQLSYGNQAVILKAWGQLDAAMGLHKKEKAICLELNDRAGLQASYGNQAIILKAWGQPDAAMDLLKKQEAICFELNDRAGLQRSYGNQALILQAWGQLDAAMDLHKKKEAICLELNDRAGLQASYGNQAVILKAWGQLDAAMALHKKEEVICLELNNPAGLAQCHANIGLLLLAQQNPTNLASARQYLESALATFTELRMPRERDAVASILANL